MIKAVIFDVDGVLLNSFEANLNFFQDLMTKTGHRPPTREEFPSLFYMNMWDVIKRLTKLDSEEEIRRIWEFGKSDEADYDYGLINIPKEADETIKTLSKKYQLGIATSRVRPFEVPQLKKLEKFFKTTIGYEDTENHKPHPDPLLAAARGLGVIPEEAVYIGDAETDLQAARAAGMKFILYPSTESNGADRHTNNFREIPDLITSL